jgi:hypothetical protein
MLTDAELSRRAQALAAAIEPVAGQVYFSPECHQAYEEMGFGGNPISLEEFGVPAGNTQAPDAAAYCCSRGSVLGQVPGEVIAAAFAAFNPAGVVPAVTYGWTLTDAATICAARTAGAVAQLTRVLGPAPEGVGRVRELLARAGAGLRPEGRPMYAGLMSLPMPGDELGDTWRLADRLREYRGDSHTAAFISAGLDAVEINLLTELWWAMPLQSFSRSRGWTPEDLDAGIARLTRRGLIADGALTPAGRSLRGQIEMATDRQCRPIIEALGDDLDELLGILGAWNKEIRAAGGYLPSGPHDFARDAAAAS